MATSGALEIPQGQMTERTLSRLRQRQSPRVLRARTQHRARNEIALPDSSRDSDSPNVPAPAKQFCLWQTIQADLLSEPRSWSPLSTHHETRVDQKASRKELRQKRRCQNVDQLHVPSTVPA